MVNRVIQFSARIGMAAAVCVVTMSGDAHAVSASYSGAGCQFYRDDLDYRWERTTNGGLNNSGAAMLVSCPITNLTPGTWNGITFGAVYVWNPGGQTTTCTIYASSVDGAVQGTQTKTRTLSGWGTLYFNGPSGMPSAFQWGSYTMRCTIPAAGAVYTYFLDQT